MVLCNSMIYRFVTNKYYDYLKQFNPIKRSAEIFRLELENLTLNLKDDDEIFGWFVFENSENYDVKVFPDCRIDENIRKVMDAPLLHGSRTNIDKGHTLVDYGYILKNGLLAYSERINKELLKNPSDEYLLAMMSFLNHTENFIGRMKKVSDSEGGNNKNAEQIKCALSQVPFRPARNFREAVQAVWIIHFLTPLADNCWYSISLGKFDEYIYPYYKKSIDEGMTKEEAKKILYNFYKLLNSYADAACLMNVGAKGYNELSELLIECQSEFSMRSPILGAVVSKDTPERIWNMLIDERLFLRGQPTFYGRNSCINALCEKGLSIDKARDFSNNSCMGISLAGEEFNSMWGCVFCVSAVLEAALNGGQILHKDFKIPDIPPVQNCEELFAAFEKCAEYLFEICKESYLAKVSFMEKTDPDPFVSLLTEGCIEKHCDRLTGAKYHNVTVECMGMVNAADGIAAVDKLVFKDKKYTLDELSEAVRNDFTGYEKIREDILKCSKFGQNSEADNYAVRVSEILQRVIRNGNTESYGYSPSLHTLNSNVSYGLEWGAGYDGRLTGTPFAKNAACSNNVRNSNATSLALSAAKLPQYKFFGGQPIDVNFSLNSVKNNKSQIAALILTYLESGGLQLQVNCMSWKELENAAKRPEDYADLVVRIGGFSVFFNWLSKENKEEFIERARMEEV